MNATELARAAVQRFIDAGVTEAVIAPGSRNAPLSFALYDAADAGLLRLHTRIDERSAGFLALGLTKAGSRAVVVCTSGTAVANLHPAMLEAAHAGVAMVAATADRPENLHGTSANQTTDQVGIFGPLIPTVDLSADPLELPAGPVHWNLRFTEPLTPPDRWQPAPPAPDPKELPAFWGDVVPFADEPFTVVVAGDDAGPPARQLAERGGWPLMAEPTSGARTGENALRCYRLLLDTRGAQMIKRVVVFGRPTLSRPITELLNRPDVKVVAVRPPGAWSSPPFPAAAVLNHGSRVELSDGYRPDPDWLARWLQTDRERARAADRLLADRPGLSPHAVAAAVSRAVIPGGQLYVGASNPIRDLDLMAEPYPVGERRRIVANRGLSGIDGVVSSAIGAALGRAHSTRNLVLMGDLTFLHDSNGLVLGPDEARPDLTIVVTNDDGGSIFTLLEQGEPTYADRFERLFGTPHGVDIGQLCAATRTPHWAVESVAELEHALASPAGGIEVIEARVSRSDRREVEAGLRALD